MSFAARKPVSTDQAPSSRRPPGTAISSPAARPSPRSSITATSSDLVQASGLARTPSVRKENVPMSARAAAARRAGNRSSTSLGGVPALSDAADEDDVRAENTQLVTELKQQLQKAEVASEQYQKQIEVLQIRLDEVLRDQSRLEEKDHQREMEVHALQTEAKEFARQKRELEQTYEAEKAIILRERELQANKEDELQSVIRRLNETIRQRDSRFYTGNERFGSARSQSPSEQSKGDSETFAPTSPIGKDDFRDESQHIFQRDRIIESLRLELADAQIKLAETEHVGDGRLQELEKSLLDARITNARLMEDNESYQLLLSEKTLKGDFMSDSSPHNAALGSLADELESAQGDTEGESDAYKRLEGEVKNLRDGNKALTLYIDRIIGRLLQHEGFEHIIHEKSEAPEVPAKPMPTEKALPPAPVAAPVATGPSFLQRAKSVVSRPAATPRSRPMSLAQPPTAHENPETAPSIPLGRSHRRSRSDQTKVDVTPTPAAAAATVVGQMYRGTPLRTISGGPTSQGISPALSPNLGPSRNSYFPPGQSLGSRNPSGGPPPVERGSSSNSFVSEHSADVHSTDASSVAPTTGSSSIVPGAVMKQNQLRPLRLVREQQAPNFDDEEAARKANRGSWFGFLKGTGLEASGKAEQQ